MAHRVSTAPQRQRVPFDLINSMRFSLFRPALASLVFAFGAVLASAVPTITTQPVNQFPAGGATTTFTMAATVSSGTLSYQWQVSTDNAVTFTNLANTAPYSNATSAVLTVTGVTGAMNGYRYRGVATQASGTTPGAVNSTIVMLNVVQDLAWDAGATDIGAQIFTAPTINLGGTFYFKVTTQATTVGAWRTALRIEGGTADVYLKQNTAPTSVADYTYKSDRAGTTGDGFVLSGGVFAAAQTWYLMVVASQNAQWSLVSGEAYVQNLGTLAADATSSSGHVVIGAEGYRLFKTTTPATAAAWRLWLSDGAATPATLASTKLAVRRTSVPFIDSSYDHQQPGHMLLVPPYLNTGGDTYFVAVTGTPGTTINLDSRSATVTDVAFGASTPFTLPAAGYAVYRVPVPIDQIGWQTELRSLSANVDLAVRRDNAGSEWFNDAFSEVPGTVGDSVTLVPPTLTNGTYYITLYNSGAAATGTLVNRVPFSAVPDDVAFAGTSLNDEVSTTADDANPNKAGWRYFRVGVADAGGIAAQLGKLGWELSLSGAPANTEIALRRNFLPGKWLSRAAFSQSFGAGTSSSYYQDFNSATGLLQRPGHQADIWYIGVYAPATALGNFSLARTEVVPATVAFASGSTAVAGQAVGTWRYFKFDVPTDADLLGWDLRVQGATGGAVTARVLRDTLPSDADTNAYDFELTNYWTRPNVGVGTGDPNRYLIKANDGRGPTATEQTHSPRGWLYAGSYYLGVKVTGATAANYTVVSRGIGTETTSYPIKVAGDLALTNGTANIAALAPRELALYRVTVPEGTPTWAVKVAPSGTGEASLKIGSNGRIPSFLAPRPLGPDVWAKADKPGADFAYVVQSSPTDTTTLAAGVYYVAVIGEGNSPAHTQAVGTGNISATLTSVSAIPVADLGTAAASESMQAVGLEAEEVKLYRFTVVPGTLSVEVRLTERTGNPYFSATRGELPARLLSLGQGGSGAVNDQYYQSYLGGVSDAGETGSGSLVTLANPAPGTYTVAVRALTNNSVYVPATANLRVVAVVPVVTDFANSTTTVTNQAVGSWRYFKFDVPADGNLLGWDLRVQGATGGAVTARVLRDTLPSDADTNAYDFELTNYWTRPNVGVGTGDPNRYLIKAIDGRGPTPAEVTLAVSNGIRSYRYGYLYAGSYYLGVKVTGATAANYTVVSRGIGTETTSYPIKVAGDLALTNGTANIAALAPRELALYRVTVPEGTPTWAVKVAPSGTGEASLKIGSNGRIPSFLAPRPLGPDVWAKADKPGADFVYAAQTSASDTTTLAAGVYYVAVIGEGNSPAHVQSVGTGSIAATLTSVSGIPATDLGAAAATETVQAVSLESEEIKLYRFTVAPGTLSVEVRLTERTGNPYFSVTPGDLPGAFRRLGTGGSGAVNDPYYGSYVSGVDGAGAAGSGSLVTLANPTAGTYTVVVCALTNSSVYTAATANLRVIARAPAALNFSGTQNAAGGTNIGAPGLVSDGTRTFYQITVPATLGGSAPLGWKLSASTTQGTVGLYVYRDVATVATPLAETTERTLILAPPVFVPGSSYLVEVRATGATNYTLTSEAIVPRNLATPWTLPTAASYATADDIGDSGQLDLANGDYDFYAVTVPEGNAGVLRTVIEAISGNPDLYLRRGSIPSRNHNAPTDPETSSNYSSAYSRALSSTTGTEYGNWVPFDQKTETQLKPGTYYLAVHAASNTNVRYRLRVSPGAIQTLALSGGSVTAQLLTGGDWRYYKVALPADATMPQAWTLTFAQDSGDAMMFVRDTVPPGFRQNSYVSAANSGDNVQDWLSDLKNGDAAQYSRYDNPGAYTFTTPPLRPGATYYVGFYAKTDSSFSLSSAVTGSVAVPPEISYYTGTLSNVSIPAGGNVLYRMVAPANAGRLKFALTPSAPIELAIEQGTLPTATGTAHFRNTNWTPTTAAYDQTLSTPWPWVPGATYYLRLANPSASAVTFSLTSDSGRVAVVQYPVAVAVASGGTATLSVLAGGSPAPTYQWRRSGVNLVEGGRLTGTQTATLTIAGVLTSDNGTYEVVVANTTATGAFSVATTATLAVNGTPLVTTQPANATVSPPNAVGFSVAAYSATTLTYRWQRSTDGGTTWVDLADSATVSGSGTANLYLPPIDATRSGEQYRAVVTNALGSTVSSVATLLVQAPAAITTQPTPQAVVVGQPFTFSVVASGIPTPTYQWKFGATNLSGATSASYTKASAVTGDAGNYSVVVTNSGATVTSSAAALTVNVPPSITTQPLGAALTVGQAQTLTVVATGTAPLAYQWRKNTTPIATATTASLALTNVQLADAADYSVVVSNAAGTETSASATVSVSLAPAVPTVIGQPQSVVVNLGQSATFSVSASGVPTPTYQWQKGTTNITGATTASYTIAAVAAGDAGSYRVVVSNTQGTATSTAATLTVVLPPTIVTSPAAATVVVGQPATFAVTVAGTATFTYQWRKNGSAMAGATNATFTIAAVAAADAGDYSVVVSNAAGVATTTAGTLTVNSPPAIPTAPGNTTVVAGQVATFTLTATGNPAPTYQWQRQAAGTTGFVALANGGGYAGVTTATLAVTTTAAMHGDQFRAVASNGIGIAATSTAATLSVSASPVFSSAASATFVSSLSGTFTVTAAGNPAPTFSVTSGALPSWATLNAATGVITGTPPNNTGSPFTFTITASNGIAPTATQAFTLTVANAVPPIITTQPVSRSVPVGATVTVTVTVVGTAPLSYVWRKDGVPLAGATGATLTIGSAQITDTGAYTVAITNAVGNAVSNVATLGVVPPGSGATHAIVGPGYVPGSLLTITNTFTFTGGAATSLGWRVLLPAGWIFVSGSATQGETKPVLGTTDLLEWAWTAPPASPLTFTYTVSVPVGQSGTKEVVAVAILRQGVAPIEMLAQPDPLVVGVILTHSADPNQDNRISLVELTRVIELYNVRVGTTRTGRYRPQDGTEDGFAGDVAGTGGAIETFSRVHSADTARDGRLSLVELTRVIELYNTRSGTTRTGAYHVQAGTEDGFAPGP